MENQPLTTEQKETIAKLLRTVCDYCEENAVPFGDANIAFLSLAAVTARSIGLDKDQFAKQAEAMFECDVSRQELN